MKSGVVVVAIPITLVAVMRIVVVAIVVTTLVALVVTVAVAAIVQTLVAVVARAGCKASALGWGFEGGVQSAKRRQTAAGGPWAFKD